MNNLETADMAAKIAETITAAKMRNSDACSDVIIPLFTPSLGFFVSAVLLWLYYITVCGDCQVKSL